MKPTLMLTLVFLLMNTPLLHAQDTAAVTHPETTTQVKRALRKARRYYKKHRREEALSIYLRYASSPLLTAEDAIRAGVIYEHRDVNDVEDFIQATYWYRKAAEKGDAKGEYLLGYMYLTGQGITANADSALYWLNKSASLEDTDAEYLLADMYEHGDGVPRDLEKAKMWYREAAKDGDKSARKNCRRLGIKW